MKINGRIAVLLSALVAIFIMGMNLRAEASQYLGQVTWTWHKTVNEQGPKVEDETITVGLFFIGGSYYEIVGGSLDSTNGTKYGGGTAMLVGNNFIMTISTSHDRVDGTQEVGIFKGQVDKTTFNGTGWAIKKRFDPATIGPNPVFIDKYVAGTLTVQGTPPPLGPASAAPLSLLLSE